MKKRTDYHREYDQKHRAKLSKRRLENYYKVRVGKNKTDPRRQVVEALQIPTIPLNELLQRTVTTTMTARVKCTRQPMVVCN